MSDLSSALEDIDQDTSDKTFASPHPEIPSPDVEIEESRPFIEHSMTDLVSTLPPIISFSKVQNIELLRRDLYDAKFQVRSLMPIPSSEQGQDVDVEGNNTLSESEHEKILELSESSDLVKGVYEGGLKTWEGGVDLVVCLEEKKEEFGKVIGAKILELGCGSALPACWVLKKLLQDSEGVENPTRTELAVQDYNSEVLELITLPNLFLTYYQYKSPPSSTSHEVSITPTLIDDFSSTLSSRNISLRFFSGAWSSFSPLPSSSIQKLPDQEESTKYSHILTSETIYSLPSLPSLLDILQNQTVKDPKIWVAGKSVYFGMKGGVGEWEFKKRVQERDGTVERIWSNGKVGMERVVLEVQWIKTR